MINSELNIAIDLTPILNTVTLKKRDIQDLQRNVLWEVSQAIIYNWREEAHRSLKGSRSAYINGIQQPDIQDNISIIELIGSLANMLESGASPFDMKVGFAKSDKRTIKEKGGWFLTVPFRWSTPDALGENEAFSFKMNKEVYGIVKDYTASQSGVNKKVIYGKRLSENELPKHLQGTLTRKEIKNDEGNVLYGSYKHKSNIFAGMTKMQKTYEKATQSQYVTFRRVSDLSDPLSWIHPGFVAKNFADKAVSQTDVNAVVDNTANQFLQSIGF